MVAFEGSHEGWELNRMRKRGGYCFTKSLNRMRRSRNSIKIDQVSLLPLLYRHRHARRAARPPQPPGDEARRTTDAVGWRRPTEPTGGVQRLHTASSIARSTLPILPARSRCGKRPPSSNTRTVRPPTSPTPLDQAARIERHTIATHHRHAASPRTTATHHRHAASPRTTHHHHHHHQQSTITPAHFFSAFGRGSSETAHAPTVRRAEPPNSAQLACESRVREQESTRV